MLDTNIASSIIRGATPALARKLRTVPANQICISSITQGELLDGLARKPGATDLELAIRSLLARVDVLAWDSVAATHYGALRAALDASGQPIGNLDTLIAAHGLAVSATLVSNDRAFTRVAGLKVENWAAASD